VGQLVVEPGAANVVPGRASCSLDVRHADDRTREQAVAALRAHAQAIARERGMRLDWDDVQATAAVPCDPGLTARLEGAVASVTGAPPPRLVSGAGHDAMVLARVAPAAMLFVRSPGGVSHHPDEAVEEADVAVALDVLEAVCTTW
jgi:allantoate deiminase